MFWSSAACAEVVVDLYTKALEGSLLSAVSRHYDWLRNSNAANFL